MNFVQGISQLPKSGGARLGKTKSGGAKIGNLRQIQVILVKIR